MGNEASMEAGGQPGDPASAGMMGSMVAGGPGTGQHVKPPNGTAAGGGMGAGGPGTAVNRQAASINPSNSLADRVHFSRITVFRGQQESVHLGGILRNRTPIGCFLYTTPRLLSSLQVDDNAPGYYFYSRLLSLSA
ncbi:hypothetical protein NHX12_010544 [Muraenolepis orangiensis]|uniref:Uncharacterized protein n=1 Tax=Muraenolepis orangiensis TaxID=630683 RepID=A0A9Q0DJY8_9TELE|nr:hypothetical protein NHX12_010544 [Muraenolepis orangiensis]